MILSGARGSPRAVQRTPVLDGAAVEAVPHYVGGRHRIAYCAAACFFDDRTLITLNLARNSLHVYDFDPATCALALRQSVYDLEGLNRADAMAISPDHTLIAVANNADGHINIHRIDAAARTVEARRLATLYCPGDVRGHGVAFSHCSRFVVYGVQDDVGLVRLFALNRGPDGNLAPALVQTLAYATAVKPKGVAFSPDGRFLAICFSVTTQKRPRWLRLLRWFVLGAPVTPGSVHVHAFCSDRGLSPQPLSAGDAALSLMAPEDVSFAPDGGLIAVSDQAADRVVLVGFDARTGSLGRVASVLANPDAQLSFPHGNSFSPDGRYLAVANYGGDKTNIYDLAPERNPAR